LEDDTVKRTSGERVPREVIVRLSHLGEYIKIARKRRKMTIAEVGKRLNLGYQTISRLEKGNPNVSVSAYMGVLWLFRLDGQFAESMHPDRDETGKALELSRLPKRIKTKGGQAFEHDF
jgi:DNA-binding XRE family transcriptional regulator